MDPKFVKVLDNYIEKYGGTIIKGLEEIEQGLELSRRVRKAKRNPGRPKVSRRCNFL